MLVRNVHPDNSSLLGGAIPRVAGEVFGHQPANDVEADWLRRGWLEEVDVPAVEGGTGLDAPAEVGSDLAELGKAELWRRVKDAGLSGGVVYSTATAEELAALLTEGAAAPE